MPGTTVRSLRRLFLLAAHSGTVAGAGGTGPLVHLVPPGYCLVRSTV